MLEGISATVSKLKNVFAVLVLIQVASIALIVVVLSSRDMESMLQMGLVIFFCFMLFVSLVAMVVLLIRRPELLFMHHLSDLRNQQGRLTQITYELGRRLTTAEQAILPILTERNYNSSSRIEAGRIVIASKDFTEQLILGHIIAYWLEKSLPGIVVQKRLPNGSTLKNFADLKHGWIDGYVEYTGTGCMLLQVDPKELTVEETIEKLNVRSGERFRIKWLKPLGNTNNYKIVMRRSVADKLHIDKIVDLKKAAKDLVICGQLESMNRPDAWLGLRRTYTLNFRDVKIVGYNERYEALRRGYAHVTIGFETDPEIDPRIVQKDFTILEDTEKFFPQYYSVPVFREEALQKISGLEDVINELENKISADMLRDSIAEHMARGSDPGITRDIAEKFVSEVIGVR